MGVTYSILCPETKKKLWIGQGDHLYTGDDKVMSDLQAFLFEHKGKSLIFDSDFIFDEPGFEDYQEFSPPSKEVE
jgi:hypothetical protein